MHYRSCQGAFYLMASLTLPRTSALVSPIVMDLWAVSKSQGAEDMQLRENAHSAVMHWESRAEHLLGAETVADSYVSIPFEPVKTVRVTYRHVGALKPAPYPLDE